MRKLLLIMMIAVFPLMACQSTRSISLSSKTSTASVEAKVSEKSATNWNVGDLELSVKSPDGAEASANATKNSMNSIVTGSLSYGAGIISALAALGL